MEFNRYFEFNRYLSCACAGHVLEKWISTMVGEGSHHGKIWNKKRAFGERGHSPYIRCFVLWKS